jgi:hypothetical protein
MTSGIRFSDRTACAAMLAVCSALVAGWLAFADAFPKETFFALPTAYYAVTGMVLLGFWAWAPAGSIRTAPVSLALVTLFVFLGQALITGQGVPTRWLAWGRFPLGDAGDFLSNAVVLIQNGEFISIRGRPLSSAFIAGLWRSVGFDLALLSIALTTLCGIALFYFARVALICFGLAGGCVAVAVAGDFLHEHLGAASTEPVGFLVGTSACALLFAAAMKRSATLFALGVGTLMLAFLMRAGALFIIPLLLLLPFLIPMAGKVRLRWVGGGLAAVIAASVWHVSAVNTFTPDSPGFVNAPKSWYAIIAMGDEALGVRPSGSVRSEARWVQIFDDHPGLHDLPIKLQGERFVEIVTTAALERPQSVIVGSLLEYKDQVLRAGLFRFVDNKPIRALVFAVFLAGFVLAVRNIRRDPVAALISLSCFGLFLSIPFLHGGENRVHIATAGLLAGTVGYAVASMTRFLAGRGKIRDITAGDGEIGRWVFGALVAPVITLGLVLYTWAAAPILPKVPTEDAGAFKSCSGGAEGRLTAAGVGNGITLDGSKGSALALSFADSDALENARRQWLASAAWEGLFYYAPIAESAVPIPQQTETNVPGMLFVAFLKNEGEAGTGTGLWRAGRKTDLEGGIKHRCLEPF